MPWYLASLAMLLMLMGCGAATGSLVLAFLPGRMQPGARMFLSVPLGWALLTLVITLLGWVGHGFAGWHCAAVTVVLSAAGAWVGRRWLRRVGLDAVLMAVFGGLASFPVLGSLERTGSFALYNDAYIYLCHAQWLQTHGAMADATTVGGHPAWGPVIIMQATHLRLGTSFVLGWVQSMFRREWSYEVYPVVAALGLICGALGVGAAVLAACPGRRVEAWLTALAAAVTVNGFAFGAVGGFLPQTWGLAFAAAACALRSMEMGLRAEERSGAARWRTGVPLGICVAASMHCYWDLLPLEGPALALTYLVPWPGGTLAAWRQAWARARVPLLTSVLLVNLEWWRAIPRILVHTHLVVANPVRWEAWEFPAHALGLKSSVWERGLWITQDTHRYLLPLGCAWVLAFLAVMLGLQRQAGWRRWMQAPQQWVLRRRLTLMPALGWIGLTVGLIGYFRYGVPSPWREHNDTGFPDGIGQSWSQYKLTTWASLFFISVVAALGTAWAMRGRTFVRRYMLAALLVVWCGTGLGWNALIARRRGNQLLIDAGVAADPFTVCLRMRQTASGLPPDAWIYLDWPKQGQGANFFELMAYFLYDHPLASDWNPKVYPRFPMTPESSWRTAADCDWVLKYRLSTGPWMGKAGAPPSGEMSLEKSAK